jgi:DNA-binding NarL/FixJ family response regulator
MEEQKIILADGSRLLRGMLKRAIRKAQGVYIVDELETLDDIDEAINNSDPDWIILSLPHLSKTTQQIEHIITDHPDLRVIAVTYDGSQVQMKWMEKHEKFLNDLSLTELISILQGKEEELNAAIYQQE